MSKIPSKIFHDQSNLQFLYLSRNRLTYLDENTFNSLQNLQTLDLSHNLLKSIHQNTFNYLKKLSELYLFDNKFESVNSNLFKNLKCLNELCLFDKNIIYYPRISIDNFQVNKNNFNLIVGKTFRNNSIGTEYIIKNNSLNSIKLIGDKKWRNFQHNFEWNNIHSKLSVLIGANGTGKTNCLKLIYLSINQKNKMYCDEKYFVCKYFSIIDYSNQEYLYKELDEFDKSIILKSDVLKNVKIAKDFIDYLYDSINYFCLIQYFDFLLIDGYDINEINKHLQSNEFRFKFSQLKCKQRQNQQEFFLKDIFKNGSYYMDKLNFDIEYYLNDENQTFKLSNGEHFRLLILLWKFHAEKKQLQNMSKDEYGYQLQTPINSKLRIQLLDQVDNFMDHDLLKEFFELITSNKFAYLNYQIIISSQNLTSFSYIDHTYIYSISKTNDDKCVINNFNNKQQALLMLSNHKLMSSNMPSKIVLIENESLLKFFNMLKYYLTKRGYFSTNKDSNEYNLLFLLTKISEDQKNITVFRLIKKFIELDETNQFYCLVENTYKFTDLKCKKSNVQRLMRYSLENYIYDPLNIFLYLFVKSRNELSMIEFHIDNLLVKDIYDLFQLSKDNMIRLIQIIVDHFSDLFIKEMKNSKLTISYNMINEKVQIKFVYDIEYFKKKHNTDRCFYIIYPKLFIEMKGIDVKLIFLKLFPCLPQDINTFIEFLRNEIFESSKLKSDRFLSMANCFRFLPYDLIQNFKNIQHVSHHTKQIDSSEDKDDDFDFTIYNEKNILNAIEYLHDKLNYIKLNNLNEMYSIINFFKLNLNNMFKLILNHINKYNKKEDEMNRSIKSVLNENITDFEKMDNIISILERYSNSNNLKNNNKDELPKRFYSILDIYNYFFDLGHNLNIYNRHHKLNKIHQFDNEEYICECIFDILKSFNEIFAVNDKSIYSSNVNQTKSNIDHINHSLQIQKMYSIIKNMNIGLNEKLTKILALIDYSTRYFSKNEICLMSNENLIFNVINVFMHFRNFGTNFQSGSFINKLINEMETKMLDNSYNDLLQHLIVKFNQRLELFILKFLTRISSKLINNKLSNYFDVNGKLKSKLLVFRLVKSDEITQIELEYPLIMLICSFEDLKFIYETIFEYKHDFSYEKLIKLVENFEHEFKDDFIFKKLLYPSFLIDKYSYIDNEIDLLELFHSIKSSYSYTYDKDLLYNEDVKRFLYNPINIFFYIYHKNSKEKLDMKDFYRTIEQKIKCNNKNNDLTYKTRIRIREIALNYVVKKFVNTRILQQIQQYLLDEFIIKKNMSHIGDGIRKKMSNLIDKMIKMNLILDDFTLDTAKSTQVTIRIDCQDKFQQNHLELKFDYPSLFFKLNWEDLRTIYEFIAPPYSFDTTDIIKFLKNENNLCELILIHYCDDEY